MRLTMLLTESEVRDLLRLDVREAGSQKVYAQQHGISEQYVSDVLRGQREPGQKILDALGFERVVYYRKV